jgi:hypothetical protein
MLLPTCYIIKRAHKPNKKQPFIFHFFLLAMPEFVEEKAEQFDSGQHDPNAATEKFPCGIIFGLIAFMILAIVGYVIYINYKS